MMCPSCNHDWPEDRFNGVHPECFRCRASTLSVAFAGGKDYFHGATIKERHEQQFREARANGIEPVPVWHKNYTASAGGHVDKLARALEKKEAAKSVAAPSVATGASSGTV